MIYVTGAAGFIGKHLTSRLTLESGRRVHGVDPRTGDNTLQEIELFGGEVEAIFHLGAISDTTCEDAEALWRTNVELPTRLAGFCAKKGIPFIFASSASVYGNGQGPLNAYAWSKALFDKVMDAGHRFPWYGCRFFNVYGVGEAHKGNQASMVHQIRETMYDGERPRLFALDACRDFIHVDDVVDMMLHLWETQPASGFYDMGFGGSYSFLELFDTIEAALNISHGYIEIDMPVSLKGKYQFRTKADLKPLRAAGYTGLPLNLKQGVRRFIEQSDSSRYSVPPRAALGRSTG